MKKINSKKKFKVAIRDNFTCMFCGSVPGNDNLEIDHLIPVSKNGSDNIENLITTCQKCNRSKSNMVLFPKNMCESIDFIDSEWWIHKSFGKWRIKIHYRLGAVLEYDNGYWIDSSNIHDKDLEELIMSKDWAKGDCINFQKALEYFRKIIQQP